MSVKTYEKIISYFTELLYCKEISGRVHVSIPQQNITITSSSRDFGQAARLCHALTNGNTQTQLFEVQEFVDHLIFFTSCSTSTVIKNIKKDEE